MFQGRQRTALLPTLKSAEMCLTRECVHVGVIRTRSPLLSRPPGGPSAIRLLAPQPWPNFELGQGLSASLGLPGACPRPSCAHVCLRLRGRECWKQGPRLLPTPSSPAPPRTVSTLGAHMLVSYSERTLHLPDFLELRVTNAQALSTQAGQGP